MKELLLPCLLRGRVQVESPSQLPVAMAVAVNGKIRAVTRTYVLEDHKEQWFAMLPEDAFTAESFDLQLFQISTVDDRIQLAPVRVLNE